MSTLRARLLDKVDCGLTQPNCMFPFGPLYLASSSHSVQVDPTPSPNTSSLSINKSWPTVKEHTYFPARSVEERLNRGLALQLCHCNCNTLQAPRQSGASLCSKHKEILRSNLANHCIQKARDGHATWFWQRKLRGLKDWVRTSAILAMMCIYQNPKPQIATNQRQRLSF